MSGLETAIKKALDRAERPNAEVRARIYQSARQALEAGLRKQNVTDPGVVADQRHRLELAIKTIEHEERQRLGILSAETVMERFEPVLSDDMADLDGEIRPETPETGSGLANLRAERLASPAAEADTAAPAVAGMASGRQPIAGGKRGPRRRRGGLARLFVSVMLLAFLAMGGWWAYTSGLFLTPAERDTSVANPPAAVSEEDVADESAAAPQTVNSANSFSKDWIEIFKPGDVDRVAAGSLASAKVTATSDGAVVRITSSSAAPEAAVRILLPVESLDLAKGRQATLAVSLRSASDQTVGVSVDCEFGGAGSCERHRFTVTSQRSDALIQVVPGSSGKGAGQPALVINSDVDGKGRGVDLIAIRILPVPEQSATLA